MLGYQKVHIDRVPLLAKIKRLQHRITMWCASNGYENIGNNKEHRGDDGEIIWKQSDWEYVDDTYGHMVNDDEYEPHSNTLRKMNQLWKRYNVN